MLTTSTTSGLSRAAAAKLYYQHSERTVRTPEANPTPSNYDSFTLSSSPTGPDRFQMDLVSRLSNEVRTSTTTGDVQALRNQVASGTYTVDPSAIAARILCLGED